MCIVTRKLFGKDDNVTFVDPSMLGIVLNGLITLDTEQIRTILRFSRSEFIPIPVNCNRNHWCGIMIGLSSKELHIDPMCSKYITFVRAAVHKLAQLLHTTITGTAYTVHDYCTDVGIQYDNYNCGVYGQKVELCKVAHKQWNSRNNRENMNALAEWAARAFDLPRPPSSQSITRILQNEAILLKVPKVNYDRKKPVDPVEEEVDRALL
ncbi:hypothetical protein PHMEG_00024405 [Phytophthora megakarya]|uniref:Ubiquitin-like protease family profile domain-containing protein n=1 Tax=Phytophthora megakarya TaxID=4795 RepID=A0A225VE60_9STRA|nr:hypothetical protein PHMEG_00024405 [Phytophthora megakarya]